MTTRRQWAGLFAASLLVAACGGGGGSSANGGGVMPPPPPPPPPPNPVVIQPSEITDAGTDRIVGLALDSLMAFASLGVLMERFGPELQRYVATRTLPLSPSVGLTGLSVFLCATPIPNYSSPPAQSSVVLNYTDPNLDGIDTGDTLDVQYDSCADWGLSGWWNDNQHLMFRQFRMPAGSFGLDAWSALSPIDGTGPYWLGTMQSHRLDQPPGFNSDQFFDVRIGGSVEKSGTQTTTTIQGRNDSTPLLLSDRLQIGTTISTVLSGRYLDIDLNAPLIAISDSQGRRNMNPIAPGRFDMRMTGLSWFQNKNIPIAVDLQTARVAVQNVQFASPAQLDGRRAEAGSFTISPTERTGYSIQVDVIDTISLRIRVLGDNGAAVSDRMVLWDDVIWNYWTATQ